MKKKAVSILKKTVKIACVTCLTMGAAAVVTSGAALKAIRDSSLFLVEKSRAILKDTEPSQEVHTESAPEAADEI